MEIKKIHPLPPKKKYMLNTGREGRLMKKEEGEDEEEEISTS